MAGTANAAVRVPRFVPGCAGQEHAMAPPSETAQVPRVEDRRLDCAFRAALWLKGVDGLLELVGGLVLLFVTPASLNHIVRSLTAHELAQDPRDFVARHLLHSATRLSRSKTLYGAVYLLGHGAAKLVLVVALLRGRLWAYPWMIGLLLVFIAYQLYRIVEDPTIGRVPVHPWPVRDPPRPRRPRRRGRLSDLVAAVPGCSARRSRPSHRARAAHLTAGNAAPRNAAGGRCGPREASWEGPADTPNRSCAPHLHTM